jgi:hypothetical protein
VSGGDGPLEPQPPLPMATPFPSQRAALVLAIFTGFAAGCAHGTRTEPADGPAGTAADQPEGSTTVTAADLHRGADDSIERALMSRVPGLQGFRALDDYELSFRSRSEAESALAELQTTLAEFELQLNESKTKVLELPLGLESVWPAPLRDYEFTSGAPRTIVRSLAEFFSLAFQVARENPGENVLKYAIARASNEDWSGVAWLTYQDLLLQCATAEPGVLKHVTAELKKYQTRRQKLDRARISDLVENTVQDHVPLGHGSEVAWAIWLSITLGLKLTPNTARLISGSEDPLVPILALHARERKLAGKDLDPTAWQAHMSLEGLRGPQWLLAYEAGVRKWLPSNSKKKHHVDQDPCFKYLKSKKVRFYNTRATARDLTRWRPRMSVSQVIGYGI